MPSTIKKLGAYTRHFSILALVVAAAACIGCTDQETAKQRAARHRFEQAMTLMAHAERGVVPKGGEIQSKVEVDGQTATETKADLQAYRQATLDQAVSELQAILDMGTITQQTATRRVLSDIYASQVRHTTRQAMLQWATLADKDATLISYLATVDRAQARVTMFDTDETQLIEQLNEDRSATHQRLAQAKETAQNLAQEAAKYQQKIQQLTTTADATTDRARQLQSQALQATNNTKQYDLYDKAATADRRSNIAMAEAQRLDVTKEILASELKIAQAQARIAQQAIQTIDQQIADAQQRQKRPLYKQAVASANTAADEMAKQFNQVKDEYEQTVESPLDQANEKIDEAIDLLAVIASESAGNNKGLLELERLARMVDKAHVLTNHITAAGGHGGVLNAMDQQTHRLIPDNAKLFNTEANRVYNKQQKLIEQAKQTISQATTLSTTVTKNLKDESMAEIAKGLAKRLEDYRKNIDKLRLTAPRP